MVASLKNFITCKLSRNSVGPFSARVICYQNCGASEIEMDDNDAMIESLTIGYTLILRTSLGSMH